ncbi:MAG: OmpA/MotB domain protein [Thermoleophilia bacterium]|nr:OmpA/MotB domain protein [Thermoleophilia bacterium]
MSGRRRDSGGGHEGGDERWLLTYADMITLLLALFIVLFAMSTIDAKKFENVKRSLSETFKGQVTEEPGSVLDGSSGALDPEMANQIPDKTTVSKVIQASNARASKMHDEQQKLEGVIKDTKLGKNKNLQISQSANGSVVLRVAGDALFASGQSTLKPGVREDLIQIERELSVFGARIRIGGHTDGQPFPGGNMRLSNDRAEAVYDLFASAGFREANMETGGFADHEPLVVPAHPFDDVPKNRRIEITVLAPGADDPRPKAVQLIEQVKKVDRMEHPNPPPIAPLSPKDELKIDVGIADDLASQARDIA